MSQRVDAYCKAKPFQGGAVGKPSVNSAYAVQSTEDKTQNTDIHKKPNPEGQQIAYGAGKTQNSPNFTNGSSFVFSEIVLCLGFVYCALNVSFSALCAVSSIHQTRSQVSLP